MSHKNTLHGKMLQNKVRPGSEKRLPYTNVAEQLFYSTLPQCGQTGENPKCCTGQNNLIAWYNNAPKNQWNQATNWQGGPGVNECTEQAFLNQCLLSQHFNYISGNNRFKE